MLYLLLLYIVRIVSFDPVIESLLLLIQAHKGTCEFSDLAMGQVQFNDGQFP